MDSSPIALRGDQGASGLPAMPPLARSKGASSCGCCPDTTRAGSSCPDSAGDARVHGTAIRLSAPSALVQRPTCGEKSMHRSVTSELPDHAVGNEHEVALPASSRIAATRAGALPAIPLLPIERDHSCAARAGNSRGARARRRTLRTYLSFRSRSAWSATHFCALFQTAPAAHLRCPWQTTLHPRWELPGNTTWRRGLKVFEPNEHSVPPVLISTRRGPKQPPSTASR